MFSRDESGLPRSWGPRADVPGAAAQARGSAAHLLSLLAVIRTDVPPSTVAAVEASICSLAAQHVRLFSVRDCSHLLTGTYQQQVLLLTWALSICDVG